MAVAGNGTFNLRLYRYGKIGKPRPASRSAGRPDETGFRTTVKTTMMFRSIANPRRTTLAHVKDAADLQTPEQPEHSVDLPTQTANPRRTILTKVPAAAAASAAE
ncbi:hypothetical protein GCM10010389_48530 [Streptomyces echinoruber]|uniref:Uncharacterized protein n=1 Tax=Streptomyces echinoruber TaxID=68898 RepID=A0A918RMM4_9ACTN|nr:hypothetical protein GCM10010389_48530 [Streptomyces echinoruber]